MLSVNDDKVNLLLPPSQCTYRRKCGANASVRHALSEHEQESNEKNLARHVSRVPFNKTGNLKTDALRVCFLYLSMPEG